MHPLVSICLAILFFAALLGIVALKPRFVGGRGLSLFRAFFPSWRFFDDFSEVPTLFYRASPDETDLGAWTTCLKPEARGPLSLFFNPRGNLRLSYQGCIEHLAHEVTDDKDPVDTSAPKLLEIPSFQLVTRIVRERVLSDLRSGEGGASVAGGMKLQFKIAWTSGRDKEAETVLISPVWEL
jgi:hypothetical protein